MFCLKTVPRGTFSDDASHFCSSCNIACITCIGSTNKDCIKPNYLEGYAFSQKGASEKVFCSKGSYLIIDKKAESVSCLLCHKTCESCTGSGPENCDTCAQGYHLSFTSRGNKFCKTCEEIDKGLRESSSGSCIGKARSFIKIEICGDGRNLGQVECDDGNLIAGDGCNSNCQIEYGFKCSHGDDLKDSCISCIRPEATISVGAKNILFISFSKQVKCKIDCNLK